METTRALIGLFAAITVPSAFSWYKKLPWCAVTFSATYGAVAVLPISRSSDAWLALLGATLLSMSIAVLSRPWTISSITLNWLSCLSLTPIKYAAIGGVAASTLLIGYASWPMGKDGIQWTLIGDDRLIIIASGSLIAVFGCQFCISQVIQPLIREILARVATGDLDQSVEEFIKAGPHVGWIERFILFSFLVSGHPEAAALVVTAKSFARFPGGTQGDKLVSDYYITGTMISVTTALVAAGATRLALGLSIL